MFFISILLLGRLTIHCVQREGTWLMPKVTFVNEKKEIEVPVGGNLRQEALKAGIQVNYEAFDTPGGVLGRMLNCRGLGLCGTCRVLVKKGGENLSPKKGV